MAQKRPQSPCQIHAQQSNADDTEGSFWQVRHDAIEPIAALANSKFALDNVAITDILILLLLRFLRPFFVLSLFLAGRPRAGPVSWMPCALHQEMVSRFR